jgi:hypothetical protein
VKKIRCLRISFTEEIAHYEVPAFRGAVVEKVGTQHSLFHNHLGEEAFRYQYPLIQYKRVARRPMLLCLDDGTEEIQHFFQQKDWTLRIGEREVDMKIDRLDLKQLTMQVWDRPFRYEISHWMALNQHTYPAYQQLTGLADRVDFLERILIGNILSFAKGIGWHVDREIDVRITDLMDTRLMSVKGQKKMAFTLQFQSNVFLPDYIGLGKHVSIGYGIVKQRKNY